MIKIVISMRAGQDRLAGSIRFHVSASSGTRAAQFPQSVPDGLGAGPLPPDDGILSCLSDACIINVESGFGE
jgi:hypothetical protein